MHGLFNNIFWVRNGSLIEPFLLRAHILCLIKIILIIIVLGVMPLYNSTTDNSK